MANVKVLDATMVAVTAGLMEWRGSFVLQCLFISEEPTASDTKHAVGYRHCIQSKTSWGFVGKAKRLLVGSSIEHSKLP